MNRLNLVGIVLERVMNLFSAQPIQMVITALFDLVLVQIIHIKKLYR